MPHYIRVIQISLDHLKLKGQFGCLAERIRLLVKTFS